MERENLEVDVLFVGAGPATLACAIAVKKALDARGEEVAMLVIEKGEEVGHHQLSGAVMDPRAMAELFPNYRDEGFPIDAEVRSDAFWKLSANGSMALKGWLVPPPLKNQGKLIVSLNRVTRWLGEKAEELGIEVYPGFAAASVLHDGDRVTGVRMVDQGRDKRGEEKSAFQPGMDILARVTVFGEGPRGSLTKTLIQKLGLAGRNPQVYETGIKEIWQTQHDLEGQVIHTAGWPLAGSMYGGGWIYGLPENKVSIGLVVGLDAGNPTLNPHDLFQRWKTHPRLRQLLEGGEMLRYGAKTIPGGGYYALPRFHGDGFVIVGDSAGFVNMMRLKGIHLAIKSGMLAAEAIAEALAADDTSEARLKRYADLFEASWAKAEMYRVRNFRASFRGRFTTGATMAFLRYLMGGKLLKDALPMKADHEHTQRLGNVKALEPLKYDDTLTFDRLKDVYHSGTMHEEDQPCHLVVREPDLCVSRCTQEYGNPCQHFCPAQVYEWHGDQGLEINASNCVHCKTCDVADPYQVIDWVVPEGGGGPKYLDM
ncbi:MAG: electron transfer flavoprotein-ubiquinone oxidoreductase [Planctomycetes bacterium]|nr:electron transfer flavoprotein-ubiquinone oxidoreductase [Planctomycetota bacterium]